MEHYFETSKDDICQVFLTGISRDNRSSLVRSRSIWVDSCTFISDISDISSISIGLVVHVLDAAIRKSNRVGTLSIAIAITSLSSIEVRVGVVISNGICVGVGRRHIRISNSCFHNWGMVSRGSMYNRSIMNHWSMVGWGCMDNWS